MSDPRILSDEELARLEAEHEEFCEKLREPIGFTESPNVVMIGSDGTQHLMYKSIYGPKQIRRFIENWSGFATRAAFKINQHHEAIAAARTEGGT